MYLDDLWRYDFDSNYYSLGIFYEGWQEKELNQETHPYSNSGSMNVNILLK